jgi:hypothetical protein
MRPWAFWQAQLLQFQDQLMASWPTPLGTVSKQTPIGVAERADLLEKLQTVVDQLGHGQRREPRNIVLHSLAVLGGDPSATLSFGLRDLGFDDLPPAGYLPVYPNQIYSRARTLFPMGIEVTINAYRADEIVEMVERTQHLDRIPLTPKGGGAWPVRIEIMVPVYDPFSDGEDLQSARSWVAFRRAQHVPERPEDPSTVDQTATEPPAEQRSPLGAKNGDLVDRNGGPVNGDAAGGEVHPEPA